jgi:hypothetical protein
MSIFYVSLTSVITMIVSLFMKILTICFLK